MGITNRTKENPWKLKTNFNFLSATNKRVRYSIENIMTMIVSEIFKIDRVFLLRFGSVSIENDIKDMIIKN